jgi:hypothetical protein
MQILAESPELFKRLYGEGGLKFSRCTGSSAFSVPPMKALQPSMQNGDLPVEIWKDRRHGKETQVTVRDN